MAHSRNVKNVMMAIRMGLTDALPRVFLNMVCVETKSSKKVLESNVMMGIDWRTIVVTIDALSPVAPAEMASSHMTKSAMMGIKRVAMDVLLPVSSNLEAVEMRFSREDWMSNAMMAIK